MPRYSRVVLKLSGGALAGRDGWGFGLAHLASEVLSVQELGLEIAVVVGRGATVGAGWPTGWTWPSGNDGTTELAD
jgi:uridylate kinase